MKAVNRREVIRKIAVDRGLSMKDVDQAVSSQFSFVKKIMSDGEYGQIRLPFFGRFWVKKLRVHYMKRRKNAKDTGEPF